MSTNDAGSVHVRGNDNFFSVAYDPMQSFAGPEVLHLDEITDLPVFKRDTSHGNDHLA